MPRCGLRAGFRVSAAQERRRGAIVIRRRRAAAVRLRVAQIADDVDPLAERRERLQDFRQLEALAGRRRRPLVHRRAVRDVDASQTRAAGGRRLGERRSPAGTIDSRNGSAIGDAHAVEERAPRQVLLREKCHVLRAPRTSSFSSETARSRRPRAPGTKNDSRSAHARLTMARTAGMS